MNPYFLVVNFETRVKLKIWAGLIKNHFVIIAINIYSFLCYITANNRQKDVNSLTCCVQVVYLIQYLNIGNLIVKTIIHIYNLKVALLVFCIISILIRNNVNFINSVVCNYAMHFKCFGTFVVWISKIIHHVKRSNHIYVFKFLWWSTYTLSYYANMVCNLIHSSGFNKMSNYNNLSQRTWLWSYRNNFKLL